MDNLITISEYELNSILNKHEMWLLNDPKGERADLSGTDLRGAELIGVDLSGATLYKADLIGVDLSGATLYKADLRGADLSEAELSGADLYGADLYGANLVLADLKCANLREANLYKANLYKADLIGVDLSGATLYKADLRGAKLDWPLVCQEKGSFIGYKKCRNNLIVELEIPEDAYRCSATSKKCRCSKAKVLSITNLDGSESTSDVAVSKYDSFFVYHIGETVEVTDFDQNRWNECSTGIHFFMNREDAVKYVY